MPYQAFEDLPPEIPLRVTGPGKHSQTALSPDPPLSQLLQSHELLVLPNLVSRGKGKRICLSAKGVSRVRQVERMVCLRKRPTAFSWIVLSIRFGKRTEVGKVVHA